MSEEMNRAQRLLAFLWPPYKANYADKYLDKSIYNDDQKKTLREEIRQTINDKDELDIDWIASTVEQVVKSEIRRKELIENKALAFFLALSISVTIFLSIITIFNKIEDAPKLHIILVSGSAVITIIHFFYAAQYAIKTRSLDIPSVLSAFESLDADEVIQSVKDGKSYKYDIAALQLSQIKYNVPLITKKINTLNVSEEMFMRGIYFLFITFITLVVMQLEEAGHICIF